MTMLEPTVCIKTCSVSLFMSLLRVSFTVFFLPYPVFAFLFRGVSIVELRVVFPALLVDQRQQPGVGGPVEHQPAILAEFHKVPGGGAELLLRGVLRRGAR